MLLRSPQMRAVYSVKFQGAVDRRRTIDPNVFLGIRIPIPPNRVQKDIVRRLEAIDEAGIDIRRIERSVDDGLNGLWLNNNAMDGSHRPDGLLDVFISNSVRDNFYILAKQWEKECPRGSDISEMVMSPAYQRIIGMGPHVIPLLLEQLERKPSHWFWALYALTGVDPIPPESQGKLKEMAEAWIAWGKRQGYRW